MVAIRDFARVALRQRRARLRRLLLTHVHLDHDLSEMSPTLRAYIRVRAAIRRSLDRSHRVTAVVFNLNAFSSVEALTNFRFLVSDLGRLSSLLSLRVDLSRRRHSVTPVECLAMVLRRLASPARWADLEPFFGRSAAALSEIFGCTIDALVSQCGHLVQTWQKQLMARSVNVNSLADQHTQRGSSDIRWLTRAPVVRCARGRRGGSLGKKGAHKGRARRAWPVPAFSSNALRAVTWQDLASSGGVAVPVFDVGTEGSIAIYGTANVGRAAYPGATCPRPTPPTHISVTEDLYSHHIGATSSVLLNRNCATAAHSWDGTI